MEYEPGQKVEYINTKGKKRTGTIHAVKKIDSDNDGTPEVVAYLIDTGRAAKVDKFPVNVRHEAIAQVMQQYREKGLSDDEAYQKALKSKDLPDDKIVEREYRHPEQIEVLPENVHAVE